MGWTRTAKGEVAWAVILIFSLNWRAEPGMVTSGRDSGRDKPVGRAAEVQEIRLKAMMLNTASGSTGISTTSGISGIDGPGTTWWGPGQSGKMDQEVERGTHGGGRVTGASDQDAQWRRVIRGG